MARAIYAAIELGGTKTICVVGESIDNLSDKFVIPTDDPAKTLGAVADYLSGFEPLKSIGIGTFGPVELNPLSEAYGCIQSTPKKNWSGFNVHRYFADKFECPVFIDTDVNAAALGEFHLGAAKNVMNFVYVTVGTGIGAGALINGRPVHGLSHPEMGHISLPRFSEDENFEGCCPFHSDCAEGFASGSAIAKRWGTSLNHLPKDGPAWAMEAAYLADFCHTITLLYSPQKIILGGGVCSESLLEQVRVKLHKRLNGYVQALRGLAALSDYLVLPALGGNAGPHGSFLLNLHN